MWSKRTGFVIALLILGCLALVEVQREQMNCYEDLEISLSDAFSSPNRSLVTKSFRQKSLLYHPDKNPSPDAEKMFIHLRTCHDILLDKSAIKRYHKFGEMEGLDFSDDAYMYIACFTLINYFMQFIVGLMMTTAPEMTEGRFWLILYLVFSFCCEMCMRFLGEDLFTFVPGFGKWLIFEKIAAIRRLFPCVLSGAMLLSSATFSNSHLQLQMALRELAKAQADMSLFVRDMADKGISLKSAREQGKKANTKLEVPSHAAVRIVANAEKQRAAARAKQTTSNINPSAPAIPPSETKEGGGLKKRKGKEKEKLDVEGNGAQIPAKEQANKEAEPEKKVDNRSLGQKFASYVFYLYLLKVIWNSYLKDIMMPLWSALLAATQ